MTDLSSRYGTRRRPQWFWPVFAGVGIALGVAFAAWVGFQPKPVSAQLWGYEVVDDHLVTVKVDVHRPDPAVAVTCRVYAQAFDHSTVGEKTVDLGPSDDETMRVTVDIETERRAVTGVLRACDVAG